jgi:hypothetical protein
LLQQEQETLGSWALSRVTRAQSLDDAALETIATGERTPPLAAAPPPRRPRPRTPPDVARLVFAPPEAEDPDDAEARPPGTAAPQKQTGIALRCSSLFSGNGESCRLVVGGEHGRLALASRGGPSGRKRWGSRSGWSATNRRGPQKDKGPYRCPTRVEC